MVVYLKIFPTIFNFLFDLRICIIQNCHEHVLNESVCHWLLVKTVFQSNEHKIDLTIKTKNTKNTYEKKYTGPQVA